MYRQPSYRFVQLTSENLQDLLLQSLKQKNELLEIYTTLLSQAPDDFTTSILSSLQATETNSKNRLDADYIKTYGVLPEYSTGGPDVTFDSFSDGIVLALKAGFQELIFESQTLDKIGAGRLGYDLYDYILRNDIAQQNILNTLYTYYLYNFQLNTGQ